MQVFDRQWSEGNWHVSVDAVVAMDTLLTAQYSKSGEHSVSTIPQCLSRGTYPICIKLIKNASSYMLRHLGVKQFDSIIWCSQKCFDVFFCIFHTEASYLMTCYKLKEAITVFTVETGQLYLVRHVPARALFIRMPKIHCDKVCLCPEIYYWQSIGCCDFSSFFGIRKPSVDTVQSSWTEMSPYWLLVVLMLKHASLLLLSYLYMLGLFFPEHSFQRNQIFKFMTIFIWQIKQQKSNRHQRKKNNWKQIVANYPHPHVVPNP